MSIIRGPKIKIFVAKIFRELLKMLFWFCENCVWKHKVKSNSTKKLLTYFKRNLVLEIMI